MKAISLSILAAALAGTGCVSHVSMRKVVDPCNPPRGMRVHLPAPFIIGTPTADNKMEYKVELLPDPEQEYAIDAWTLMASQKAEIARTIQMYVQKVSLKQNTAEVATELARAAGEVGKQAIATMAADKEAEEAAAAAEEASEATEKAAKETAAAEKAAERKAEIDKAQAAVDDAKKALDAATAEVKKAEIEFNLAADDKKADAKAKFEKSKVDRDLADAKHDDAVNALRNLLTSHLNLVGAGNKNQTNNKDGQKKPANPNPHEALLKQKRGPVIFQIVEDGERIKLKPVSFKIFNFNGRPSPKSKLPYQRQMKFETLGVPKSAAGSTTQTSSTAPKKPDMLTPTATTLQKFNGPLVSLVTFDTEIKKVLAKESTVLPPGAGQPKGAEEFVKLELEGSDKKTVKVSFKKPKDQANPEQELEVPLGIYTLSLLVHFGDNSAFSYVVNYKIEN